MHSRFRPALTEVTLTDDFWKPYLEKIRTCMVPNVLDRLEESGYLENFRFAAAGIKEHKGPPFSDGLFFETIRGISDFLAVYPDPAIEARLDGYIEQIAAAQEEDGFLCTQTQCCYPDRRWGENGGDIIIQHDLYDQGALIEAGIHHYRATGKTALLEIAVRSAGLICRYIGYPPKANRVPGHSLPEEAMVKLCRLFRDESKRDRNLVLLMERYDIRPEQYLDVARFWYDNRGNHQGRTLSWDKRFPPPYNQDHLPFAEQREAMGHAVRATLCYTGAAAVQQELDAGYRDALDALWDSVTLRKMHISGGIGTRHDIEGFDVDYNLPNNAYLETCAGVGLAFWSGEMALLRPDGMYFDCFERALYNNVLASVGEDGKKYFYQNPLVSDGSVARWDWHGCPCCPPMLLKLFSSLPTYIYTIAQDTVEVNLYIDSECTAENLTLSQKNGRITADSHGREITLRLRIPEYAENFTVDGKAPEREEAGYAVLTGVFTPDKPFLVQYDLPVRRICAHPAVEADRKCVAVTHGPFVYCAEGCDNAEVNLTLAACPELVLQNDGIITGKTADGTCCRLIPYYRWNNRGAYPMQVWFRQENWQEQQDWEGKLYDLYHG